jgi:hypothetical protein
MTRKLFSPGCSGISAVKLSRKGISTGPKPPSTSQSTSSRCGLAAEMVTVRPETSDGTGPTEIPQSSHSNGKHAQSLLHRPVDTKKSPHGAGLQERASEHTLQAGVGDGPGATVGVTVAHWQLTMHPCSSHVTPSLAEHVGRGGPTHDVGVEVAMGLPWVEVGSPAVFVNVGVTVRLASVSEGVAATVSVDVGAVVAIVVGVLVTLTATVPVAVMATKAVTVAARVGVAVAVLVGVDLAESLSPHAANSALETTMRLTHPRPGLIQRTESQT